MDNFVEGKPLKACPSVFEKVQGIPPVDSPGGCLVNRLEAEFQKDRFLECQIPQ